ncbi:hypothetical protein WG66_011909 [Moniliophthora roreri]|nr:hypothetical protein WG66_011909 [Moniliophthora roreri]
MPTRGCGLGRRSRITLLVGCIAAVSSLTWLGIGYQWSLSATLVTSVQVPPLPWENPCSPNETQSTGDRDVVDNELHSPVEDRLLPKMPQHPHGDLNHTTIPQGAHVHGYTVFDQLYMRNGTLYIVTDKPETFPEIKKILSIPGKALHGVNLTPTEKEMVVIDPSRAKELLGSRFIRLKDLTVLLYDPDQFMHHYYHWWGEIILGLWRVYSKLGVREDGSLAPLPFPARFMMPFVETESWRDRAKVDGPLMRATFPGISIEGASHWEDLIRLEATVIFERVMLVNRYAAHTHPFGGKWFKMMSGTMSVTVPDDFWKPLRDSLLSNILGYIPEPNDVSSEDSGPPPLPVVTYVSRQGGGRSLVHKDHDVLILELMDLEDEGICELYVAEMEKMSLREQIELAARTTIMLGVHGNGLTHQLWMPPSPQSTVIEIMVPGGYVYDYEILARNMGHKHYAVWNDTYITYPKGETHKGIKYPPGFHGTYTIPVHGPTVADIVRQRLTGP